MPPPVRTAEPGTRLLIVSADDYGLTDKVSRAILKAHRGGIVTSTSVLALAPAFDASVRWLGEVPRLGVGAHLAAVGEDPPLLSAAEIPTLVDRRGRLRSQLAPVRAVADRRADRSRPTCAASSRPSSSGSSPPASRSTTSTPTRTCTAGPSSATSVLDLAVRHGIGAVRDLPVVDPLAVGGGRAPPGPRRSSAGAAARGIAYPEASTGDERPGQLDLPATIRALHRLAVDPGAARPS